MQVSENYPSIAGRAIGPDRSVFIICEIGMNHNGSLERAIRMVDDAIRMGADCAKFQMRCLEKVYRKRSLERTGDDLNAEYTLDLLRRFELTPDQHRELKAYCDDRGIVYMCTPWDSESADFLDGMGVSAFKVSSADLTNWPLIEHLSSKAKPLILSTGMSNRAEIEKIVELLNKSRASFALLHCNSTYPAPLHDVHLRYISELQAIHPIVGYSGHERGISVSLAAVALGAQIIERHYTMDRGMEGPDHAASLDFDDFAALIRGIREVEVALGPRAEKSLSQGVMMNRENLGKSLVAAQDLKAGCILVRENVSVRSPGQGLSPLRMDELLGKVLKRDMDAEDFFYESDLKTSLVHPRSYSFHRPWGIPVRYHDFQKYAALVTPDLWEFHLSYKDLELNPDEFLVGTYAQEFVVHAPELFAGSHLMDLASPDNAYRFESIQQTQRVVNLTRQLKQFFPKTNRPLIVANIGGISMDQNLPAAEKTSYYERFIASLEELDLSGVELIPQTMAPFPWHFGGQRYQNLFVHPEEIEDICERFKLRICLDVSHSKLTCNVFNYEFYSYFLQKVGPFVAHLHIGDAVGSNGEGLQVGSGEIDFRILGQKLQEICPRASFIPEIWQGHKDDGEGFWIALERLERLF